jgi:hypothetical protein
MTLTLQCKVKYISTPMVKDNSRRLTGWFSPPLLALFLPGTLFVLGLVLLRDDPRFSWIVDPAAFPWEFWVIALAGALATSGGLLDWVYHRSGSTTIGQAEHRSEMAALGCGGLPLFLLMASASVVERPAILLLPILVVVLFTAAMICYDEFVFHRRRCGRYETMLHRLLVFGNGIAWLVWMHWCFVRGGGAYG